VPLPEFARTTTFRWTLAISGAFTLCTLLMFAFVILETREYTTSDTDRLNLDAANAIAAAAQGAEGGVHKVMDYLAHDARRIKLAGLFDAAGNRIAGNILSRPLALVPDSGARDVELVRSDSFGREEELARALARHLPDGAILVIGRTTSDFLDLVENIGRVLAVGLVPALCLSLAAGAFLSVRAQRRIEEVNARIRRIVAGDLRQRLPAKGTNDPFDKLQVLVNGMLEEIEALVRSMAGVGDDIAHDLRTPLTRVRVGLERAREHATTVAALQTAADQAILGLDQSLGIITALLRIAEIEHNRRLAGFRDVALSDIVEEVGDLYEPIAEDKRVAFAVRSRYEAVVCGDRDLLFEAISNLVDNAIKFTPEGGRVELALSRAGTEAVVRVSDTGPGIPVEERDLVVRRFYRSDKSRRDPGLGLGLSLVSAIARLHDFRFTIMPGPGCVVELAGPLAELVPGETRLPALGLLAVSVKDAAMARESR
jgi:signal transduction histidine kinase